MRRYIGAIDAGTSGIRFVIFDRNAKEVASAYQEIPISYPKPGWVEQDPERLVTATLDVIRSALDQGNIRPDELAAVGLANQRETTIVWDRETGKPVHPAIVWQDRRTASRCAELAPEAEMIRDRTGLPVDPYFSATKLEWLLDNVPGLSARAARGEVLFGTVDAWLLARLAGVHATDPTNASRTLLFDIANGRFDPDLLALFGVPETCLPEVRPSLSTFGRIRAEHFGVDIPVAGILGDQQAALFGQTAFRAGEGKVTWGTGAFLLMNTGDQLVRRCHPLLSTVAYTDSDGIACFAIEGSVFVAGAAIQWLRDGLGILGDAAESEAMAREVPSTDGVYFVPALVGLGAPNWDPGARGLIVGITRATGRAHLVRAALEAIAHQTLDVVRAMEDATQIRLTELRVDGGAAANDFLCQFQSDLLGIPVVRPVGLESTALGAAFAAGLAVGLWSGLDEVRGLWREELRFEPAMEPVERDRLLSGWARAVERSLGWERGAR